MFLEARWAEYARIQSSSIRASSVIKSDADDVRLNRLVSRMSAGAPLEADGIERAVKSYVRRERNRQRARRLTEHAFTPSGMADPEEVLIWKEAWSRFERAFPEQDFLLLMHGEIRSQSAPMKGADRTRLSRIRASAEFRSASSSIFPQA